MLCFWTGSLCVSGTFTDPVTPEERQCGDGTSFPESPDLDHVGTIYCSSTIHCTVITAIMKSCLVSSNHAPTRRCQECTRSLGTSIPRRATNLSRVTPHPGLSAWATLRTIHTLCLSRIITQVFWAYSDIHNWHMVPQIKRPTCSHDYDDRYYDIGCVGPVWPFDTKCACLCR